MADSDVRIKVSMDGDKVVIGGLQGIGDSADKADSRLGGLVSGGLRGAGVALAGLAIGAAAAGVTLTKSIVDAYAAYEQNVGGIETMFGDAAGTMSRYADEAYRTAGLSANEYMSQATSFSASLLQGLGGDTAAAAEYANMAMIDMSDNANKFGTDIGAIQNAYQGFAKGNFTMLDNLRLGYGGTREEMARLVNDAGVMGDGFVATAANIDEVSFDQIVSAIHTVQDEMGIAGTTALEAEATISGSIGMLQGSWANLLTGLGSADADVATLAGNVISSFELVVSNITPVIENIGTNIAELGPQLGSMGETLVGALASAIPAVLDAGVALIGGLIQGIGSALPGLVGAAVPLVTGLVEMIVTQLPLLIDAGMQAITVLGQGLVQALPTLLPMMVTLITGVADAIIANLPMLLTVSLQIIQALADGLITALPMLIAALPTLIMGIINFVISAIPQIIQAGIMLLTSLVTALPEIIVMIVTVLPQIITSILDALLSSIPLLIQAGIDLLTSLIDALPAIIVTVVAAIPQIVSGLVRALVGAIPQLVQAGFQLLVAILQNLPGIIGNLVSKIPQIISSIVSALGQGVSDMISIGGDLVAGLWNGISGAAGWLMGKISGFVNNVMGNIGSFFGIASPSKRMRDEIGAWLPSGIGEGVEQHQLDAIRPIRRLGQQVMDEASAAVGPQTSYADPRPTSRVALGSSVPTPLPVAQGSADSPGMSRLMQELRRGVRVASGDMDVMANKVARALRDVRQADGRDTMMAIKQGAL